MFTRREINKLLATSALLPAPLAQLLAETNEQIAPHRKPLHLVYESRAADYGWRDTLPGKVFDTIHYIDGDVTRTWFEELHPLWSEQAILTAGLTRESEFFVMKTLARDYDYVVVKEIVVEKPHLVSWLLAPN